MMQYIERNILEKVKVILSRSDIVACRIDNNDLKGNIKEFSTFLVLSGYKDRRIYDDGEMISIKFYQKYPFVKGSYGYLVFSNPRFFVAFKTNDRVYYLLKNLIDRLFKVSEDIAVMKMRNLFKFVETLILRRC